MSDMSIFSDATDAAARVTRLTWFMIVLAAVVYAAVMGVMVVAMRRNRDRDAGRVDLSDRGNRWVVVGGLIMPAIVLAAVLVAALGTMGRRHEFPGRGAVCHRERKRCPGCVPELRRHPRRQVGGPDLNN